MDDFRLTAGQIAELRAVHRKQRDKRFTYRINAIILLGSGWSTAGGAEVLLIDETSVRHWLAKYRQGGVEELLTLHYQGKEPSLTAERGTAMNCARSSPKTSTRTKQNNRNFETATVE